MKLQDIFEGLSGTEFSQLSFGGQPAGVINEHNYKQVLTNINMGVTALFGRFNLKEGRIQVALKPGQTIYHLKSDYAVAKRRSQQPVRYIEDTVDNPFLDDIMKITRVLTDTNNEMVLNDVDDQYSVLTPNLTTISVPSTMANQDSNTPYWLRCGHITVIYRAAAPVLNVPIGPFDPNRIETELPYTHLEALLYFVASRVNNPIGMSNEFHAGNNYAAKFEQACMQLTNQGMAVDQGAGNTRLQRKGFV